MAGNKDIWFVVVNPHAGSGKTMPEWQKAEKKLRSRGLRYRPVMTTRQGHAVELVKNAAAKGYRRFIAVGGDGTAHEVLNGIMLFNSANPEIPLEAFTLAVIPIGSGNDWIKAHDVPHDTEDVVELLAAGRVARQDVVKVSLCAQDDPDQSIRTVYMLNVGGIGFDARVCEIVNAQKAAGKTGKLLYIKALMRVLSNFYSFPAMVVADGEKIFEGDCYSIAFGIGQYSGGGLRQVPSACTDDGLLDLLVIPKVKMGYLATQIPKLFNGRLEDVPELIFRKVKRVEVAPLSDMFEPMEVDGEVIGRFPVSLEVVDGMINVLDGTAEA